MLRVNSPTIGDELRTVIFTEAKVIFTAVKSKQRREVILKFAVVRYQIRLLVKSRNHQNITEPTNQYAAIIIMEGTGTRKERG